jgi:hypothetical protein
MRRTPSFGLPFLAARRPVHRTWLADSLQAAWASGKAMAALPFDALRAIHASAVTAGFIQNSMLASRDFEHVVVALERITLGPLARRV